MTARYDVDMQLGYYDVPGAVLSASGVPLAELIGERGAASVDDRMGFLGRPGVCLPRRAG